MKKGIYKLNFDCGRSGDLEGVFIATDKQVEKLISSEIQVYFGEVMGKHSEVFGKIEKKEIKLVTEDENVISLFELHDLSSGHDPFTYGSVNFEFNLFEEEDDMCVKEIINKLIELE